MAGCPRVVVLVVVIPQPQPARALLATSRSAETPPPATITLSGPTVQMSPTATASSHLSYGVGSAVDANQCAARPASEKRKDGTVVEREEERIEEGDKRRKMNMTCGRILSVRVADEPGWDRSFSQCAKRV